MQERLKYRHFHRPEQTALQLFAALSLTLRVEVLLVFVEAHNNVKDLFRGRACSLFRRMGSARNRRKLRADGCGWMSSVTGGGHLSRAI